VATASIVIAADGSEASLKATQESWPVGSLLVWAELAYVVPAHEIHPNILSTYPLAQVVPID